MDETRKKKLCGSNGRDASKEIQIAFSNTPRTRTPQVAIISLACGPLAGPGSGDASVSPRRGLFPDS